MLASWIWGRESSLALSYSIILYFAYVCVEFLNKVNEKNSFGGFGDGRRIEIWEIGIDLWPAIDCSLAATEWSRRATQQVPVAVASPSV